VNGGTVRDLIAEDQVLLRDGLTRRMLAAYGFDVTTATPGGAHLADEIVAARPDVAVVDVRLLPTFTDEGLRAALAARRLVTGLPVAMPLSDHRPGMPQTRGVNRHDTTPRGGPIPLAGSRRSDGPGATVVSRPPLPASALAVNVHRFG
jgi:CheY-like chemotaxis protein